MAEFERKRQPVWLVRLFGSMLGILVLACFAVFPLGWREQAIIGLLFIAIAVVLNRRWRSHRVTLFLMVLSIFCSVRYIYFRISQTYGARNSSADWFSIEFVCVTLLILAELYALITLLLGYFQTVRPLRRDPTPLPDDTAEWPTVDIYIPTYNEPLPIVRPTVLAALNIDWPADKFRVYVLDDGRREEFRTFAEQVGAQYLQRDDNKHAKAGNINHAMGVTSGEYIAIFDCDHIPTRSFLQMTIGSFLKEPELAMLQTPHHFYSPDPFERNLGQFRVIPNEGELFYGVIQDGNDLWNATFFCGSCAVLRRTALEDIGGVAVETVTEDAHTAFRMHKRGWNTAYINIPQAAGLATESLAGHIGQRIRWARGMVQVFRREFPPLARGLTIPQRICYINSTIHFLYAVPRLIFLTAPLVYLIFGRINIYGYSLAIFAYALPHLTLANMTNSRIQGRHRFSFWNEIYETVLAPYIIRPTLLALINPKLGSFNVTAKGGNIGETYFDSKIARPTLVLLALNLIGLALAIPRYYWWNTFEPGTVIMNAVWTLYNVVLLSAAVAVAWEARQQRQHVRIDIAVPFTMVLPDGRQLRGSTLNVSGGGAALKLSEACPLAKQSVVQLFLSDRAEGCALLGEVIGSFGSVVRLQYKDLTLEQEEMLTRVLYSRADSWLGWRSMESDRPLHSLAHIAGIAWRTLVHRAPLTGERGRPTGKSAEQKARAARAVAQLLLVFALLSLTLAPSQALARGKAKPGSPTAPPSISIVSPAAEFSDTYDLSQLAARPLNKIFSPVPSDKDEDANRLTLPFTVPVSKVVNKATLSLRYSAPAGYTTDRWSFYVLLNNTLVQTVPVQSGAPSSVDIELPVDLLVSENTLVLHVCAECRSAENGKSIEISAGTLHLSGLRLLVADDLKLLPAPFFEGAVKRGYSVPFAFPAMPDNAALEAAGIVASWFGSQTEFRGVRFPTSLEMLPKGNVVLIGRDSELDPALHVEGGPNGTLALRTNPSDPYGKLLIVAGADGEALRNAARYLASSPSAHEPLTVIPGAVQFAGAKPYGGPRWLDTQGGELGTAAERENWIIQGSRDVAYCRSASQCIRPWTRNIDIYFRMPPDLHFGVTEHVSLTIKYQYTGLGSDAVLRVRLNGYQLTRIRVDSEHNLADVETTIIGLPVAQLQRYMNQITLQLVHEKADSASAQEGTYLQLRSARLDLREIPHYALLPKLELFGEAGFPFTKYQDLSSTAVILPDKPTTGEIGLYLDTMGFFGTQTGAPVTSPTVRRGVGNGDLRQKDLLVIGTRSDQPLITQWASSMPMLGDVVSEVEAPHSFSLSNMLFGWLPSLPWRRQSIDSVLANGVQADGVITSFESPIGQGHTVVLMALREDRGDAAELMGTMFIPGQKSGTVWGTVSILRRGAFRSFDTNAKHYGMGTLPPLQTALAYLARHYWLIPFIVLLFAIAIGIKIDYSLERRARMRLQLGA